MLRLFLNGKLFWSAKIDECPSANYAIYDLKGSYKIDQLDTLSFTILKTHPMFSSVRLKRATFLLHDKTVLFFGRVSELRNTYDFRTEVGCEEYFGMLKDDWFSNYYDNDYLTNAEKTEWDTANELITNVINYYNPNYGHSDDPAGINSAWPNLPKITKGYTNFVGESANIQVFDIGGKSFYDVLYSELVGKCGGFFRMRVTGKLLKSDGTHVDGYQINKIYMDYLSSEDDYRIDPSTGLLYDYTSPSGDVFEIDLSDQIVEIADDQTIIDYDNSVDVVEDPSLEPVDDDEDVPATYYYDDDPNTIYVDGAVPEGAHNPQSGTECVTDSFFGLIGPYPSIPTLDEGTYEFIDNGMYYTRINTSSPSFTWYDDPRDGEAKGPIYFNPVTSQNGEYGIASKETVINNINDGEHRLGLYIRIAEENRKYLPSDGRIPGEYFQYVDSEGETQIIQLKIGANWFDYKQVSMEDFEIEKDGVVISGEDYDHQYTADTHYLKIGRFLHSTTEYWIVDTLPVEDVYKISCSVRLYLDPQ